MERQIDLQMILGEVRELRETVDDLTRRLLAADDRRAGVRLVPLLAKCFGSTPFVTANVLGEAGNQSTQAGSDLYELLADRLEEKGAAHIVGRLLHRLKGVRFNGCCLHNIGIEHGAIIWKVVSDPSKLPSDSDLLAKAGNTD